MESQGRLHGLGRFVNKYFPVCCESWLPEWRMYMPVMERCRYWLHNFTSAFAATSLITSTRWKNATTDENVQGIHILPARCAMLQVFIGRSAATNVVRILLFVMCFLAHSASRVTTASGVAKTLRVCFCFQFSQLANYVHFVSVVPRAVFFLDLSLKWPTVQVALYTLCLLYTHSSMERPPFTEIACFVVSRVGQR